MREEAEYLIYLWLRAWDGKGLGNFVPEDEQMVDLVDRIVRFGEAIQEVFLEDD